MDLFWRGWAGIRGPELPDSVRRPAPPATMRQHPARQGPARGIRGHPEGLLRASCGSGRNVADAAVHVVDHEVVRVDAAPPAGLADGCQDGVVVGAGMALAAAGHLPGGDAGAQGALGIVVVTLSAYADEREQVCDLPPQPLDEPLAVGVGVPAGDQAPHPGLEVTHLAVSPGSALVWVEALGR